jgi:hypothetical protein
VFSVRYGLYLCVPYGKKVKLSPQQAVESYGVVTRIPHYLDNRLIDGGKVSHSKQRLFPQTALTGWSL